MEKENILNLCLCEGRHSIPQATDGAVFENELDPLAVETLERQAFYHIWSKANNKGFTRTSPNWDGCDMEPRIIHNVHLNLYVTGLTVALVAVLNALRGEDVTITLWHFDRTTETYYPQEVK